MADPTLKNNSKWTEIEHLPEWDEDFYDVYTAKKHGKWVMLKTLKQQYKDDPHYRNLIEKEFDVRYNLAHPGIVMINDFEEVPGLGMCIITDDVYGLSLRKLIDTKKLTIDHVNKICTQLIDALDYIQLNHIVHVPIKPETIIFTENIENLKLIDVGFDQKESLSPTEATDDIYCFGKVLGEALDNIENPPTNLRKIAEKCTQEKPSDRYPNVHALRMAIAGRSGNSLLILLIIFLLLMVVLLIWIGYAKPSGITSFIQSFSSILTNYTP